MTAIASAVARTARDLLVGSPSAHGAAGARSVRVFDALAQRGARSVVHGTRTLYDHLSGTYATLKRWRQPEELCLAGAMHSVYSTDVFDTPLMSFDERDAVRTLIGEPAERLVTLFCSIDRGEFFDRLDGVEAVRPVSLRHRERGTAIELSARDVADLIVLYAANAAEQSAARDGGPAPWLARFSGLRTVLRTAGCVVPAVFDASHAAVGVDDERGLIDSYARALNGSPDEAQAAGVLEASSEAIPWFGEPFVVLGLVALAQHDAPRANQLGRRARAAFDTWGTAWDKRLPLARWDEWANYLTTVDARAGTRLRDLSHTKTVAACLGMVTAPKQQLNAQPLPPRFARYMAAFRDNDGRAGMGRYPGLTARRWHDAASIGLARELERNAAAIEGEFRSLDPTSFHRETESIKREGSWDIFVLFERGRRIEENCRQAPLTAKLIESSRTVRSLAGLVYFSRLAPHSRVAAHHGPTNLRLRCHLGIDVPPDCGIRVGGETRTWEERKCIVFDDYFTHEVWNESDRERVVLIADLWHPDLTDDEVKLLEGLHRYVAHYSPNLQGYWARNDAARRAATEGP